MEAVAMYETARQAVAPQSVPGAQAWSRRGGRRFQGFWEVQEWKISSICFSTLRVRRAAVDVGIYSGKKVMPLLILSLFMGVVVVVV